MLCFIWGDVPRGRYPRRLYSDGDLEDTSDYCQWLIDDGYTHEPHDEFDLAAYIAWAKSQRRKPKDFD
jgi:hypothetical protein